LPYRPDGYATRTHSLLSSLAGRGWHASGVTRLGYPGVLEGREDPVRDCEVGAVSYFHLHASAVDSPVHGVATYEYLVAYCNALLDLARAERPEILHASSNYLNGLAANAVARALGIKSVYEVRGLWEISRVSREPEWKSAELFSVMSRMEAQVAAGADQVVCITHALKEEMVRRGVPEEKITVVSNGVDIERFVPRRRHRELAEELGVAGKKVIGYVGSMSDYEGLDLLLQAIARLRDRGTSAIAAVLVGDGDALASLKQLAEELAIADMVTFTGRVPHDRVEDYYSIIDVAPFPRKSTPVTEIVSPLKPFEAMAMKKIVIASNVAALAEIIEDGVNGLLFQKDDVDDLVSKLETVLAPGFAHALRPREWVVENRSWQRLSGIVEEVYKRLVAVS
jgi:glycosyltransferase involved in cell wall biosynthesis